jgi:quercetin dioxygenase-like cupin family protein
MNPRDIHSLEQITLREGVIGYSVETLAHYLIDGVYTKVFVARKAGTFMGQHSHEYEHGTLVSYGAIRLFLNGNEVGDYSTGEMISIAAGRKHVFLALEDNTVCACIHNTHGVNEPSVLDYAKLETR